MEHNQIINDLIHEDIIRAYQLRYGDEYRNYLTKTLRPSPVQDIAQRYGVSVGRVRKIKYLIWLGAILTDAIQREGGEERVAEELEQGLDH